ncbi:MAG: ankyrin repeat domain-containing protein [Hyphomicrobiaceae bacterium]
MRVLLVQIFLILFALIETHNSQLARAQIAPSQGEIAKYRGLHAAAWAGDTSKIKALAKAGANLNARDPAGRSPLHVATFAKHAGAMEALAKAGADPNLLENDKYDIITIAAVAGNAGLVKLAVRLGGNPANITSVYDGTALIAAAHLGHVDVVKALIAAGAPLDHVNNLGWTALIEAVVLGDGGPRHTETARALVEAGANTRIADRSGHTPLDLAKARGYAKIVDILQGRN